MEFYCVSYNVCFVVKLFGSLLWALSTRVSVYPSSVSRGFTVIKYTITIGVYFSSFDSYYFSSTRDAGLDSRQCLETEKPLIKLGEKSEWSP